jgi:3-oxoadipate enol-lactonase
MNFYTCFPELRKRHRVIALDHRGHGRGIRSRSAFRLEDCADDAAALAGALDLGACTVVGYSMGGAIAQLLWRRRPEVVGALVLCATAARFSSRRFNPVMGAAASGAAASLSLMPGFLRRSGMAYATNRWMTAAGASDWAAEEWSRHDPSSLIQAGLANSRFDATLWTGQIDVPTAVVVTELDEMVSPRRQRFLAEAIPGAREFRVAAGHRAVGDAPELFLPALLAAIDAVS